MHFALYPEIPIGFVNETLQQERSHIRCILLGTSYLSLLNCEGYEGVMGIQPVVPGAARLDLSSNGVVRYGSWKGSQIKANLKEVQVFLTRCAMIYQLQKTCSANSPHLWYQMEEESIRSKRTHNNKCRSSEP